MLPTLIGHCFFPEAQGSHGLLYALTTFGVGFALRRLGGLVIERLGDGTGRKPARLLSFSLMGFAILGVVLTPSDARIGNAAPLLLVFLRLVPGFALGGQVAPYMAHRGQVAAATIPHSLGGCLAHALCRKAPATNCRSSAAPAWLNLKWRA